MKGHMLNMANCNLSKWSIVFLKEDTITPEGILVPRKCALTYRASVGKFKVLSHELSGDVFVTLAPDQYTVFYE